MLDLSGGKSDLYCVGSGLSIWKSETVTLRSDLTILNRVVGRSDSVVLTLQVWTVGFQFYLVMATSGLRVEDRLDGGEK